MMLRMMLNLKDDALASLFVPLIQSGCRIFLLVSLLLSAFHEVKGKQSLKDLDVLPKELVALEEVPSLRTVKLSTPDHLSLSHGLMEQQAQSQPVLMTEDLWLTRHHLWVDQLGY